jgi:hypothetical protein
MALLLSWFRVIYVIPITTRRQGYGYNSYETLKVVETMREYGAPYSALSVATGLPESKLKAYCRREDIGVCWISVYLSIIRREDTGRVFALEALLEEDTMRFCHEGIVPFGEMQKRPVAFREWQSQSWSLMKIGQDPSPVFSTCGATEPTESGFYTRWQRFTENSPINCLETIISSTCQKKIVKNCKQQKFLRILCFREFEYLEYPNR